MARRNRYAAAGTVFHVINRGNDKRVIFRKDTDYQWFRQILREAARRHRVALYAYCQMPNHFHLLVRPETDETLSAYMQWVTGRYACDFRAVTNTVGHGHVFQRRFWNAPVDTEEYFRSVHRYIEGNPVRAGLVADAQAWPWSSFSDRKHDELGLLSPLPFPLPSDWRALVNLDQRADVVAGIRRDITPRRGRPPGS
jgi:REP-associated tyrosine transposase